MAQGARGLQHIGRRPASNLAAQTHLDGGLSPFFCQSQDPAASEAAARTIAARAAVQPALTAVVASAWRPVAASLAAGLAARPPPGAGGADVAAALARIAEVCPHVHR